MEYFTSVNFWLLPILVLFLFFAFALLLFFLQLPRIKGRIGEYWVQKVSRRVLDEENYRILSDVILPTEDGTTQIDHIIVSNFGLFVVETKHMRGWIFGRPDHKEWTQVIYGHRGKFQNPLRQNYKHVKTLEALLNLATDKFVSVVVFTGKSRFKTEMPENVTDLKGFIRFVKSKQDYLFSKADVEEIVDLINQRRIAANRQNRRKHNTHVKSLVARRETTPKCPRCGGDMLLRTIQTGDRKGQQFWRCARDPSCRGIVKST